MQEKKAAHLVELREIDYSLRLPFASGPSCTLVSAAISSSVAIVSLMLRANIAHKFNLQIRKTAPSASISACHKLLLFSLALLSVGNRLCSTAQISIDTRLYAIVTLTCDISIATHLWYFLVYYQNDPRGKYETRLGEFQFVKTIIYLQIIK